MTYYPVIIPTLNRYQHFKECIESLSACTHSNKTEIIIGLDYPPSEKYVAGWKLIKEYIPTITGFKKVTVFEHDKNLGAFGNTDFLRSYVTQKYDAYIYTEDDNVFSPCFLDYMDKCLEKYSDDENIIAVSGYMNPIEWSDIKTSNVIRMKDYMAWGIGIWKRTWNELEKNMPNEYMKYVCSHRNQLKKLKNNYRELYQLIFWTKSKPELNTRCDFTIACYCIINNKCVINPTFSLVRNNGYDGSGVNCGYQEDNSNSLQKISNESTFSIKDTLTEEMLDKCQIEWNKWKNKDFTNNQKKDAKQAYVIFMIFGYFLGNFFLLIVLLKNRAFQSLKRRVNRILK